MTTSALFVLHDVGDAGGGAPWADAFRGAGWSGSVVAPDLPGHAGALPPEGGHHEPADAAFAAVRALGGERDAVVVGVGVNGWNAQLHGLAGRASVVVLVDGLGGPWTPVRDAVYRERDRLRAIADDPAAVAPPPDGSMLDPRLRHGLAAHGSRSLAQRAASAMPVPVLVLESPASPVDPDDAAAIVDGMAAGGALVRITDRTPTTVAAAVVAALVAGAPNGAFAQKRPD